MEKKERRGKEWRRKEGWWEKETRRRGNRGLPQLDKYFQFFGRSWNLVVSKVERDTTTHLPVKFVFEVREGEGSISSSFRTVSRSVSVLSFHRVSKDEGLLRFAVDWEGERRFIYWTWFMHSIRDFNRLSSAIPNFSFIFIADFF